VKEFIQQDAVPEKIVEEIARMFTEPAYSKAIKTDYTMVRNKLGSGGCSANVAQLLMDLLSKD
jgi:lipid-A-disaccharide synthase